MLPRMSLHSRPLHTLRHLASSLPACPALALLQKFCLCKRHICRRDVRQQAVTAVAAVISQLPPDNRLRSRSPRLRQTGTAQATSAPAEQASLTAQASQEVLDAKSAILLDILTSGNRVEAKLAEHASEVDPVMLGLLEKRIQAAFRSDEEAKHIEGLHMLLRRLRLIVDRQSAKPSELLLDDLLSRMGQPDWSDAEEQQQEVMECMRLAFGLPEQELNIFGLASNISSEDGYASPDAQTGLPQADDDLPIVSIPEFAKDSRDILKGALKDCVELRKALESRRYQDKVHILEQTLKERMLLAKQVEELIRLADHVTIGLSALDVHSHADQDPNEDL